MMRSRLAFFAVTALVIASASAHALESSMTARSPLSPGELWNKIGDFCAMSEWDPAVELCDLSADGKQRTTVFFGEDGRVVAVLEDWDEVNRNYGWTNVSELAPVKNYHARVSVIADGQTSALKLAVSYEANGVSDTEAQKIVDSAMHRSLCTSSALQCSDDVGSATPAEVVWFDSPSFSSAPLTLRGYLRHPHGTGPFPAVVLLHGCNGFPQQLDQSWGVRIAAWGYVTLTIDRFGPRRLKNTCRGGGPSDVIFDAYSALDFLVRQRFIDPRRVVVVGFSQGGWLSLSSVERGTVERASENKFRAAAAFYPPCTAVKGPMTVPTLILIGESDDWTPADACRKLVNGQDDFGISRQKADGQPMQLIVYRGAHHAFDVQNLQIPAQYFGHHLEFNKLATDQSSDVLHDFLQSVAGEPRK
jgi:dienelactone hydrolase